MSYSLTFNEAHSFKRRDCCSVAREILRNLAEAIRIIYFFTFALVFLIFLAFQSDVSISYSSGSSLQLRMYNRGAHAPAKRVKCAENGNFSISNSVHFRVRS